MRLSFQRKIFSHKIEPSFEFWCNNFLCPVFLASHQRIRFPKNSVNKKQILKLLTSLIRNKLIDWITITYHASEDVFLHCFCFNFCVAFNNLFIFFFSTLWPRCETSAGMFSRTSSRTSRFLSLWRRHVNFLTFFRFALLHCYYSSDMSKINFAAKLCISAFWCKNRTDLSSVESIPQHFEYVKVEN